jgi:acyl dehydratase
MTETRSQRPATVDDLQGLVGDELGPTAWRPITQELIDAFADVTDDHQWIHVNPARASVGTFGTTIAHGLFTLSLGPALLGELMSFDGFARTLNYGYDKVRFPAPLPVDGRVRMRATIRSVELIAPGTAHVLISETFEQDGGDKPVCVAVQVSRFIEHPAPAGS